MKRFTLPLLGVLCSVPLIALAANDPAARPPDPGAGKLIVHEWGTFTGLAGSDGRHLPFRSGIGSDLPAFVLTRLEQAQRLDPDFKINIFDFGKDEAVALVRMETPVVYFYTDRPRDVDVRVEFPQGMLTEFYPPVRAMTPAYNPNAAREVLKGTSLDWGTVRLVPQSASANYPKVEGTNHYAHARATDAATVQFSDRPGEVHEENFLFYRGLGDFSLPVALTASGRDHFVLHNHSAEPVGAAFLIRNEDGKARYSTYRNVRGSVAMKLPSKESQSSEPLDQAVVKALVAEGLYEKEARAMVKTWEANWFGDEGTGTRVLYMLPRCVTDKLLPLRINPTPDETVRVLVGRIDILTPEQEGKLASMFPRAGSEGAISPDEAREAKALGRFLVPAVARAADIQSRKVLTAIRVAAQEK